MLGDLPGQIDRAAGRPDSTRIEFCQPIRCAITVAGIRG